MLPFLFLLTFIIQCAFGFQGKLTVTRRLVCGKFTGSALSMDTHEGEGRKQDWVGGGWAASQPQCWLPSADSMVSSEAGMTPLSCPYLCERTVSLYCQVHQSLMQAAPGRVMTSDEVAQLRQLGTVSLALSLGNETVGPGGGIWVAQYSIQDQHLAEAFRTTYTFETSVTPSMTLL